MNLNRQHMIKHSGIDVDSVLNKVAKEWESVYPDCRIVSLSIVDGGAGLFHGVVIYEEV